MERPPSEQELVRLVKPKIPQKLIRPPSYSDSFFFMPVEHSYDTLSILSDKQDDIYVQLEDRYTPDSKCLVWTIRSLSFAFHIFLIGIFESLFFFLFISKSEDKGIQEIIQNYINGILSQCGGWSANQTNTISNMLILFINATQVKTSALDATNGRTSHNATLEIQAWLYVICMFTCICCGAAIARFNKMKIPWQRILIENFIMVALLGVYEFAFFKTIIYNYRSLTVEELNGYIVTQLQGTCNLLLDS
jgi:hypothetical protein